MSGTYRHIKDCWIGSSLQFVAYPLTIPVFSCRFLPLPLTIFVTYHRTRVSFPAYLFVIIYKKIFPYEWYGFCSLWLQDVYAIREGTVNQNRFLGICLIFLIIIFIFIQPAYVGPGGIFAKDLLSNFWVKLVLALMALTCLPLAFYIYIRDIALDEHHFYDLRRPA